MRRATFALLVAQCLVGCSGGDDERDVARGRGLTVATLPTATQARIYEAALRRAFELSPSLSLLLDPRLLSRKAGFAPGPAVAPELEAALRGRGVIQGDCQPDAYSSRENPRCDARTPGYVIRFSEVFRAPADSVQVHVAARRYDTRSSPGSEVFGFETVYQIVGTGDRWRVVREARVPNGS